MRWRVGLISAALVAVVATDTGVVLLHDEATPYGAQQALADFRRSAGGSPSPEPTSTPGSSPAAVARGPAPSGATTAATPGPGRTAAAPRSAAAAAPRPAATSGPAEVMPGVYSYATVGHEQVDALGGARHDYPAESAMSYTRSGCGSEDKWQPLKERYSLNLLCRGAGGLEARRSVQRREFFGQSEEQVLVCSAGLVLVPDRPRPGQTSSGQCRSDDTAVALTVRVVDTVPMTVGGRRTEAVHIRVDGTLSGSTRGSTRREEWFTPAGLLLRGTATTDTDRDTSPGTVHYYETFDMRLTSLDPQR